MHLPSARGHPFRRKLTLSAVVSRRRDPFETINRKQQRDAQGCRQRASLSEDFMKWFPFATRRRREIILPEGIRPEHARPIRSETRARLVASIARGCRWLDELIADPTASADSIAK